MLLSLARRLEEGRHDGALARGLARVWGEVAARGLARPLALPAGATVVAVGGATLGGSGKTPLAMVCARELARQGARVALVGHAYRARPGRARVVQPADAMDEVGDEALLAARALRPYGVPVVVAPSRAEAVTYAARAADLLVLDGVLQTAPARAALSLLAVDAEEPWGHAAAPPPRGDLRAPVGALLAASDCVVRVGDAAGDAASDHGSGVDAAGGQTFTARVLSRGAHLDGALLPWETLRTLRVGLACAIARPQRVVRSLTRRGIEVVAIARGVDHGPVPSQALRAPAARVDVWLATPKCALHVPSTGVPLATLEYDLVACAGLLTRLSITRLDPRPASAITSKVTCNWGRDSFSPDPPATRPRE